MSDVNRIHLRPATDDAGDLAFLCALYASTRAEELAPVPWPDDVKTAFLRSQFEAQHVHYHQHYAGANFDVIMLNKTPIGRLYVHRTPNEFRLMDIALLPEYRNQGIGSALIEAVLAEADAAGIFVGLHVERFNPAYRLYTRMGFVEVEDREVYVYMTRPVATRPVATRPAGSS